MVRCNRNPDDCGQVGVKNKIFYYLPVRVLLIPVRTRRVLYGTVSIRTYWTYVQDASATHVTVDVVVAPVASSSIYGGDNFAEESQRPIRSIEYKCGQRGINAGLGVGFDAPYRPLAWHPQGLSPPAGAMMGSSRLKRAVQLFFWLDSTFLPRGNVKSN